MRDQRTDAYNTRAAVFASAAMDVDKIVQDIERPRLRAAAVDRLMAVSELPADRRRDVFTDMMARLDSVLAAQNK